MANVSIKFNGKEFLLSCDDGQEEHLEELLNNANANTPKLVVFESLYSMEGLRSPLQKIIEISKKYNALTYLDEVHSVGLYGPEGRGITAEKGLEDEIDLSMAHYLNLLVKWEVMLRQMPILLIT